MGVNGLNNALGYYGLNLVLGGGEITLLDHTYAFATFGNLGTQIGQPIPAVEQRSGYRTHNPIAVLDVIDSEGNVLMKADPQGERVISEQVAYLMADIMSDDNARAPAFGANTALTLPDRKVGAKTGTTNGFKDNWTMGFTPQATVGVWVGNTDNESMENATGLTGAAPIWNQVMSFYHRDKPARWYERPPGIVTETVCLPSGLVPTNSCGARGSEIFLADNLPTQQDNIWQTFEIDSATGLLANAATPDERRDAAIVPRAAGRSARLGARKRLCASAHPAERRQRRRFQPQCGADLAAAGRVHQRQRLPDHRQRERRLVVRGVWRRHQPQRVDSHRRGARRRREQRRAANV